MHGTIYECNKMTNWVKMIALVKFIVFLYSLCATKGKIETPRLGLSFYIKSAAPLVARMQQGVECWWEKTYFYNQWQPLEHVKENFCLSMMDLSDRRVVVDGILIQICDSVRSFFLVEKIGIKPSRTCNNKGK